MHRPSILATCLLACPALALNDDPPPIRVKVLVLNFDPTVPSQGGQLLHEALGWQDPRVLAQQYETEVDTLSGGRVDYEVVQWVDRDEIPVKTDGYQYTADEYYQNWQNGGGWHMPDTAAYAMLLNGNGVIPLIDNVGIAMG